MKIPERFTRTSANLLGKEVVSLIKKNLPEEAMVEVSKGSGSFDEKTYTCKVVFSLKNEDLKSIDQLKYELDKQDSLKCPELCKLPEWGFKFTHEGESYKHCGYSRRSKKRPIIAERLRDKKKFSFPIFMINMLLKTDPNKR
jgi:hypothetical protein